MRKINYKGLRVIIVLIIIDLIVNILSLHLHSINYKLYNSLLLIETFCLILFFYSVVFNPIIKKTLLYLNLFYFAYWTYDFVKYGTKDYMNTFQTVENILILLIVIYYYYEQILKVNVQDIFSQPQFWVVTAYFPWSAYQ